VKKVCYDLSQQKGTLMRRGALHTNAHQLAAWELLIEALGVPGDLTAMRHCQYCL
jgi:hypothetical protein